MAVSKTDRDPVDILLVAKLLAAGNSLGEIAEILNWDKTRVGRYRDAGLKANYLKYEIDEQNASEELRASAKGRYEELELDKELATRPWAQECKFHIVSDADDEFNRSAANRLADIISSSASRRVGIMWGGTIERVLNELKELYDDNPTRLPNAREFSATPLCGEPTSVRSPLAKYSSSMLAARLQDLLNHSSSPEDMSYLTGVPAYLPISSPARSFVEDIRGYQEIFVGPQALADDLDLILTGVGVFDPTKREDDKEHGSKTGIFLRERLHYERCEADELATIVHGEIAGILIPKAGISDAEEKRIGELNKGWNGAQRRHLLKCVNRASEKMAGVVAIVRGAHKAELVYHAIRAGMISQVICDREHAKALP